MRSRGAIAWKIVVSLIALGLAFLKTRDPKEVATWLDTTFLILLAIPPISFLVPWKRLTTFRAGGVELMLESASVNGAIRGIEMSSYEMRLIRRTLYRLQAAIEEARGSRVLWVDDYPEKILGERRLLRALGIEVASASSSELAHRLLSEDNDFDLIISDIQRKSESESTYLGYGGIEFVNQIRTSTNDPATRALPVVFYTAYDPEEVQGIFSQVAPNGFPDVYVSHSIQGLLKHVFATLPAARADTIRVRAQKPPTDIRLPRT